MTTDLSSSEIRERLDTALASIPGIDGVNNHMGSKLTASRKSLIPVMEELSDHGMFFLDSRTTPNTVAEAVARESGMLTGARDVFLDDEEDAPAVERQLRLAEAQARANGSAIAIGHPHPETLKALAAWTKTLESRGFTLVTVKQALELRTQENRQRVSSLAGDYSPNAAAVSANPGDVSISVRSSFSARAASAAALSRLPSAR